MSHTHAHTYVYMWFLWTEKAILMSSDSFHQSLALPWRDPDPTLPQGSASEVLCPVEKHQLEKMFEEHPLQP